jgi:hypothetical protein
MPLQLKFLNGNSMMKYIKLPLISLLAFFILFTLIGLLFPSSVNTVKAVVVNKQQPEVLARLSNMESWLQWYPFFDPPEGAAVNNAAGNSPVFVNNKNELQLLHKKTDSSSISFLLKAFTGVETETTLLVLPVNGSIEQTQVMWKETEHLKWYPWERFRGLLLEGTRGVYLDTALNRFKIYAEAQ